MAPNITKTTIFLLSSLKYFKMLTRWVNSVVRFGFCLKNYFENMPNNRKLQTYVTYCFDDTFHNYNIIETIILRGSGRISTDTNYCRNNKKYLCSRIKTIYLNNYIFSYFNWPQVYDAKYSISG